MTLRVAELIFSTLWRQNFCRVGAKTFCSNDIERKTSTSGRCYKTFLRGKSGQMLNGLDLMSITFFFLNPNRSWCVARIGCQADKAESVAPAGEYSMQGSCFRWSSYALAYCHGRKPYACSIEPISRLGCLFLRTKCLSLTVLPK